MLAMECNSLTSTPSECQLLSSNITFPVYYYAGPGAIIGGYTNKGRKEKETVRTKRKNYFCSFLLFLFLSFLSFSFPSFSLFFCSFFFPPLPISCFLLFFLWPFSLFSSFFLVSFFLPTFLRKCWYKTQRQIHFCRCSIQYCMGSYWSKISFSRNYRDFKNSRYSSSRLGIIDFKYYSSFLGHFFESKSVCS